MIVFKYVTRKRLKRFLTHFSSMPITAICSGEPGPTVVINFLSVPYSVAIYWQLRSTFSPKHKLKTKYN